MKTAIMRTSLLWPALAALALSGCSVGHTEYSRTALQHVDMSVTGIPTVLGLGILGTTIPLTPEYSLTAAHVAKTAVQAAITGATAKTAAEEGSRKVQREAEQS